MYSTSTKVYSYQQKRESKINFQAMKFESRDTNLKAFVEYVKNGHAITHIFKDNRRIKDNYMCTSFICLDIDGCPIDMPMMIERIAKKPTMAYYTASNGYKGEGFRYRFIYLFDELIDKCHYQPLVCSINHYLKDCVPEFENDDNCSENINQLYFGCDCSETNLIVNADSIYHLSEFPHEPKNNEKMEGRKEKKAKAKMPQTDFFNDLCKFSPWDFLNKYRSVFQVQDHSNPIAYRYGAFIFDGKKYEEVCRPLIKDRLIASKDNLKVVTIKDGQHRRKKLCADAIQYRRINPKITLENLVYDLMYEIYVIGKYDNTDNVLNTFEVYKIADYASSLSIEEIMQSEYKGNKHLFRLDNDYCKKHHLEPKSYCKTVAKLLRMEKILPLYNSTLTIIENVENLRNDGIKISEKTLSRYLKDGDVSMVWEHIQNGFSGKDNKAYNNNPPTIMFQSPIPEKRRYTDDEIGELYDVSKSLKDNLQNLKQNGIHIGKDRLYSFCKRHHIETNPNKNTLTN